MFDFLRSPRRKPRFAVDLGTANLRVVSSDGGLLLEEPSICCFRRDLSAATPVAVGRAAWSMLGRTPRQLQMKRPLARGVLTDMDAARALLEHARRKIAGNRRLSDSVLFGVPSDSTLVERRALAKAAEEAGMGSIRLVDEPMAAAIGAGLPIAEPRGSMLIECGAGTTEIAVVSTGGISARRTARIGGTSLDQTIADHLQARHKFLVGSCTAECLKLELSGRVPGMEQPLSIRGRSLISGLPGTLSVEVGEFDEVIRRHNSQIVSAVQQTLAQTPPELSCDIFERGITLTGGSAGVPLLAEMITRSTGLEVAVADQADLCVSRGLQSMLQH